MAASHAAAGTFNGGALIGGSSQGGPRWYYNRWLGRWRQEASELLASGAESADPAATGESMAFDDSDRKLVERVKEGDVRAFEMLHRRYHARIYRYAFMRLGNAEDAADVASHTFCKALSKLHDYQFRRSDSIYPWLHQIASNRVVDLVRDRPAGGMLSLDAQAAEDVDSFLEYLPADGPSAQELVERSEVQEVVRQAIEKLPADQGRAIALRFLGDLSIKDIACAMDRSEGAVKSLLHRALQSMRQHLKGTVANSAYQGAAPAVSVERADSHGTEVIHLRQRDS
jgi:RNA polymerase sigma-70 factor (ECF subfamily)